MALRSTNPKEFWNKMRGRAENIQVASEKTMEDLYGHFSQLAKADRQALYIEHPLNNLTVLVLDDDFTELNLKLGTP